MRNNITSIKANGRRISVRLVLSYVFDWLIIILATAVGAYFSEMTPNKRPFSLENPEISYPFQTHEKVSTVMLGVCGMGIPAAVILVVCMLLVPGPTVAKSIPKKLIWARKLWEWHTGWLGLALSLSAAFVMTSGMKNLFGKPRPDLISRCQPDIDNLEVFKLGGYGGTNVVSADICLQTDTYILNDGFRSYPSGHSSFSAAGLIYLSLFLASKLAITLPYLAPSPYSKNESRYSAFPSRAEKIALERETLSESRTANEEVLPEPSGHNDAIIAARNQAAGPPIYLLVIAIVPFFASIYIVSTRYSDFRHHGFDILFGYLIGTTTAILAFRWYHLPIRQGAGWSWGPRSRDRSFWAGVGVGNYVGLNNHSGVESASHSHADTDLEVGASKPAQPRSDVGVMTIATV